MGRLTLIVGGQKSGKSSTAARLARDSGRDVVVLAPAEIGDDEMRERVDRHRRDRPPDWRTLETFDLAAALGSVRDDECVLVDALDTWLTHEMGRAGLWTDDDVAPLGAGGVAACEAVLGRIDTFVAAALGRSGPTLVVAGQPGVGLHPMSANGRRYVDLHGLALQRLGRAGRVMQVVAGVVHHVGATATEPLSPRPVDACALAETLRPVDDAAARRARRLHDQLAKPPGSLGALEELGARLAGVARSCPPPVPANPAVLIAAADHGVHEEGVTPWPREVTAAVVRAACDGGAVSRALADAHGVRLAVLDVGVAGELADHRALVRRRVRHATQNLRTQDAMTAGEAREAMDAGAACATALIDQGTDVLLLGEVGLANTTASACVVAALANSDAAAVTGRGSGADDTMFTRKREVVAAALRRLEGRQAPLEVLAAVGGLEHAALVGAMLASAHARVPVLLDGVATLAAALVGCRLRPALGGYLVASHRSVEPAADIALAQLGLAPLLDLGMRLGEGSGALVAWPLLRAAAAVLRDSARLADL